MSPTEETITEQLKPVAGNSRNAQYDLRQNPKPNCNEHYIYWHYCISSKVLESTVLCSMEHLQRLLREISDFRFQKVYGKPTGFALYFEDNPLRLIHLLLLLTTYTRRQLQLNVD